MGLNVTSFKSVGRAETGETVNVESGTVGFQTVTVASQSANSGSAIPSTARVVRLETDTETHFKFGSTNAGGNDEILKAGHVYYKRVDGGETPQTFGV
jgi:hypothetical protein